MQDTSKAPHNKRPATRESGTSSLLYDLQRRLEHVQIKTRIAHAREEAPLTQPQLGDLMQPPVHWRTVQEWESQKNDTVPWKQLDRIAEVTGRTTHWLLHGSEEQEPTDASELEALRNHVESRLDAIEARQVTAQRSLNQFQASLDQLLEQSPAPRAQRGGQRQAGSTP